MATAYIKTTHQSGGLTQSDYIPDRVHAKIGIAEGGEPNKIYFFSNFSQAKNILIKGELLDSIQQYFEEFDSSLGQIPSPVLCIRPINDIPGTASTPVKSGTGLATAVVDGASTGNRKVIIKVVSGGKGGIASYRKSTDNGLTYGSTLLFPSSESSVFLDSGISVKFKDDPTTPDNSFVAGDTWTFDISAPRASATEFLKSIDFLKREYRAFWLHILFPADRAFSVSVDSILSEMESTSHNHPCFAILEVPTKGDSVSVADYFQSVIDEWEPFHSDRVSIVVSEGRYIEGGIDNAGGYDVLKASTIPVGVWRNAASMLTAKLAANQPNVSAGYVKANRSLTFSEVRYWNEGYQNFMDILHDARFVVLKEYNDYDGIFIAADRIKSHPDSDFIEIPERRRADKMHRIVYQNSLPFLKGDTNLNAKDNTSLSYIKAVVDSAVSQEMELPGKQEISKHEIVLDPDKDFTRTKILKARLKMFVAGRINAIEWTTTFGVSV